MEKEEFKYLISEECERIKELLISKNYEKKLDDCQIKESHLLKRGV